MSQASTTTAKSSHKPAPSNKDSNTLTAPPATSPAHAQTNVAQGLKQAHTDVMKWFSQSHGTVYDSNVAKLEANGVKREHVVYGFVGFLVLYLLAGSYAAFVSNLIVLVYPVMRVVALKPNNQAESSSLLSYWVLFAAFAMLDVLLYDFPAYYVIRTAVLVFGYLPQTRGSCLIYTRAFEPLMALATGILEKAKLV
ncbi:unnamed protein product [Auanema sp. JU1783]|nr:unnamed protein product [Auanema sp. JU1783]